VGVGRRQRADAVAGRLRHAVGRVADQEGLHGTHVKNSDGRREEGLMM
jgi:hypothetical protein